MCENAFARVDRKQLGGYTAILFVGCRVPVAMFGGGGDDPGLNLNIQIITNYNMTNTAMDTIIAENHESEKSRFIGKS